ncbi:MAG: dihydroorotate dehydrogenase electron transfer subunit [bacterium]|nr:dihydroorotate dehydrogenase electron transfer subunit [bacterium]
MTKQLRNCRILAHKELTPNNLSMQVEWLNADQDFQPAQFVQVETSTTLDPLIRRPFSIFDTDPYSFTITYKKIGAGTQALSTRKKGDTISIIGPLGNFYPIHKIKNNQKVLIVGGGTGIASVHYLAKVLEKKNINYTLLIGFSRCTDIFCEPELQDLKGEVIITTNDGSKGKKGFVTEHFNFHDLNNSIIFICGPEPMTRAWQKKSELIGIQNYDIYASLEEYMGCGLGICNGCVVKVKIKKNDQFDFKCVCTNGPVFNLKDIIWT